ncbi:M12 family metallopeptidase [Granulosicoccus antarcticus]|uniref:Flavastacin n=1 Tax=Granulosicoccus antarcticus IMCC3135 TaxID=1192854 RepID=A0A2Z2P5Q2_9GAMM|nr:M12 family metallopeptidase [Granulosicoccus antarcticus]ASJ75154.1 Flavastacin [Granulosicoccus antarcticus IMCC3135]
MCLPIYQRIPVRSLDQRPSSGPPTASRTLSTLCCATILVLAGCARADDPELFNADPALLNDFTDSLPTHGSTGGFDYAIIQGLAIFEGDILLGTVDETGSIPQGTRSRGLARNDAFGRWPDGIVPYLAPTQNSELQQVNIEFAIQHWMENTGITFVERTDENADQYPSYLRFDNSNSCASYVGMQGGEQSIMVSDGCTQGSIIHEIGHALGLFHEHTRSDRDNYIGVDWSQIIEGKDINFTVQNAGTQNYGDYDFGSIMHYGEYFFSISSSPTIIVPAGIEIGQRVALSDIDALSVDQMYQTDLALLPPNDSGSGDILELGITVLNQGKLGAHELQLVVKVTDDAIWQSVSSDSGWECLDYDTELRCTRPTLSEFSESRFTVQVDAGDATVDDVMMLLTARTYDPALDNNHYNDDGTLSKEPADDSAQNVVTDSSETTSGDQDTESTTSPPPVIASAQTSNVVSNDASSGGSDNGSLLLLALGLLGWRRYRAHIAQ